MSILLKEILSKINYTKFIGNADALISEVIELDENDNRNDVISWCNEKNINRLKEIKCGTIICPEQTPGEYFSKGCNYIIVNNPRNTFREIIFNFFYKENFSSFTSPSAKIDTTAKIGKNVFIGHNVVIEKNTVVGDNCYIGHNTVIFAETRIGNHVKIGANNTIGGIGFGYTKSEAGEYESVPHLGNVVLKDRVEIGSNTCIDRAVLGSTILNENVKVDNLVHIAHGVVIGKNSLIIANSMLGGSCRIGENVWVAPSVSILNKLKIGHDSMLGMGAVVIREVDEKTVVVGNPAKKIKTLS